MAKRISEQDLAPHNTAKRITEHDLAFDASDWWTPMENALNAPANYIKSIAPSFQEAKDTNFDPLITGAWFAANMAPPVGSDIREIAGYTYKHSPIMVIKNALLQQKPELKSVWDTMKGEFAALYSVGNAALDMYVLNTLAKTGVRSVGKISKLAKAGSEEEAKAILDGAKTPMDLAKEAGSVPLSANEALPLSDATQLAHIKYGKKLEALSPDELAGLKEEMKIPVQEVSSKELYNVVDGTTAKEVLPMTTKPLDAPSLSPTPGDQARIFAPTPSTQPVDKTIFQRMQSLIWRGKKKLPQDAAILRKYPDSPVITIFEKSGSDLTDGFDSLLDKQWYKAMTGKNSLNDLVEAEARAVQVFNAMGRDSAAYDAAVQQYPEYIQSYMAHRNATLLKENWASKILDNAAVNKIAGPYLPRLTETDFEDLVKIQGTWQGLERDISTTIGQFGKHRQYETMLQGMADGVQYKDPRLAVLFREWKGMKKIQTAEIINNLEQGGVISKNSKAFSSPIRATGLPGAETWYVRSKEEAEFIRHQFADRNMGFHRVTHYMNQLFRNPNLFNPLPHFDKNMLHKYRMSGGSLTKLIPDMYEYFKGEPSQILDQYNKLVPHAKSGKLASQLFTEQFKGKGFLSKIGLLNKPSSNLLFKRLDPAIRYARFKQYVKGGMNFQEAANNTWLDLIRYNTRSDLIDAWKTIPFNFFVPWRVGTVTSLVKNIRNRPIRTALWIGAVDYLRDAYYRKTGRWFHLPHDYVETPVAEVMDDYLKGKYGQMAGIAGTTMFLGPGGGYSMTAWRHMMDGLEQGDLSQLKQFFWGIAQGYDVVAEMYAYERDGDKTHLTNILTTAALGDHDATTYEPRRLMQFLPEIDWMPGMTKDHIVKWAEHKQETKQRAQDRGKTTKEQNKWKHFLSLETPREHNIRMLKRR